ncbi:MAG: pyridoxamine 5'-phosphate oxidase family protein [Candidatus Lokiarchaeota archaeon]|nr:pyridoxamine 5'-phosphate oxidase family protein [Candidatus Lokiarchaeota archaeon]
MIIIKEQEVKDIVRNIIENAEFVHLGTIDKEGYPNIRLMMNLKDKKRYPEISDIIKHYNEGFVTYLSTNTSSNKIQHIKDIEKASLYYESTSDVWQGVMFLGTIEIVNNIDIKNDLWEESWVMYYPKGLSDPDFTILKFSPHFLKYYAKLNNYCFKL